MTFEITDTIKYASNTLQTGRAATANVRSFDVRRREHASGQSWQHGSSAPARMAIPVMAGTLWLLIGLASAAIYLMV